MSDGATAEFVSRQWSFYKKNAGRSKEQLSELESSVSGLNTAAQSYDQVSQKLTPVENNTPNSTQETAIRSVSSMQQYYEQIDSTLQQFKSDDEKAIKKGATLDYQKNTEKYKLIQEYDQSISGAVNALLADIGNYLSEQLSASPSK